MTIVYQNSHDLPFIYKKVLVIIKLLAITYSKIHSIFITIFLFFNYLQNKKFKFKTPFLNHQARGEILVPTLLSPYYVLNNFMLLA